MKDVQSELSPYMTKLHQASAGGYNPNQSHASNAGSGPIIEEID